MREGRREKKGRKRVSCGIPLLFWHRTFPLSVQLGLRMGPVLPLVPYLLVVPVEGQDIFLPQVAQDGPRGWARRQPAPLRVSPPDQEPQDGEEEEEESDEQPGRSCIHPHCAAKQGKK